MSEVLKDRGADARGIDTDARTTDSDPCVPR